MARRYTDRTSEKIMQGKLARVLNTLDKREGSIIYDAMAPNSSSEITGVGKVIVQPLWNGGGSIKTTITEGGVTA